jgi:hypothetical protein
MDPTGIDAELERLVGRALRRLPSPRAPQTLLPRVMAAVQSPAPTTVRARSWFAWPLVWQATSVAALVTLIVGISMLLPDAQAAAGALASRVAGGTLTRVAHFAQEAEAMAVTMGILWRTLLQPIVWYLLALLVVMSTTCAAFGAALSRVALGGFDSHECSPS